MPTPNADVENDALELDRVRRRRDGLLRSLRTPHPATAELVDVSIADWGASLPIEDESLVDEAGGTPVRWVAGRGWVVESA